MDVRKECECSWLLSGRVRGWRGTWRGSQGGGGKRVRWGKLDPGVAGEPPAPLAEGNTPEHKKMGGNLHHKVKKRGEF